MLSTRAYDILFAGKVHDIGKIKISDNILNKPGKLTADEYEIMKHHVVYSYEIVMEKIKNTNIATMVKGHHERLDGSGYPDGLKGDEISLESRIIAVVDSYNAMTTDRPYKKGMKKKEALLELQRSKGILYDALVVYALEKALY